MLMKDSNCYIHFSLPEQYGIIMYLNGDEYEIYPEEGRLTDGFLDKLLLKQNYESEIVVFSLQNNVERDSPIKLYFDTISNTLSVQTIDGVRVYSVSYMDFVNAFIEHVKKYAIYFAAPCNYKAIMQMSFDEMVKKMKGYQQGADDIIKKIDVLKKNMYNENTMC